MPTKEQNQRCKEFLSCLGNGKSIYDLEEENSRIDERLQTKPKNKVKINTPLPKIINAWQMLQINLNQEVLKKMEQKSETESILNGKLLKTENFNWGDGVEFALLIEHNCKFIVLGLYERDLDFTGDKSFETECMAFENREDAESFISKIRDAAAESFKED